MDEDQIGKLVAEPELLDNAIAATNADDDHCTEPLRREQAALLVRIGETRAKVNRLVDAITEGGAGFQSIRGKLTLEERNLRLLEHDLTRVKTNIDRVAGEPLDAAQLRHVLQDFDTLFTVANVDEREQLLKLLIKRIVFRGYDAAVTMELFAGVNLQTGGSKSQAFGLRRRVSNPRPGG